ncbi:type III PLP-dependent enzyme [Mycolicibacterium litorale]|uniref:Ornithine decarboxylase n=1 Tax=Mycolicibacterium litorale TaxID=758802 RepID=A0AAD1II32_9MYCO|nr:type III PLP-dependent enzyme [Mycolicibacterium litorale]MCV7414921.1 type III PLP-dependent enzyme [Mycolicibacterium litorale]TDY08167.1 ornithine decarboxylase [Mycolicibacterium litorale]BBY16090.1 ornithine decarboxylase [Mycolicibacterium litorale]
MNHARRQQLRDALRAQAVRHSWADLVAAHRTPLLILDPNAVSAAYRRLSGALPGFHLHYAVKALPHPAALTAIALCGGGFDVATSAEVDQVRALGVPMNRCIHTHPVKKPADIDHAYRSGVRTFVVDNPVEAQKFSGRDPDIEILVRLAFTNPTAKSDLSTKFGAELADAELVVKHVLDSGVTFAGFSFHVGSQGTSVQPYRVALRSTLDLCGHVERALGVRAHTIDIGGGIPVSYRDPMPGVDQIAGAVDEVLGDRRGQFRLLAEPGRFLAADAMILLTSVVGTATRGGKVWHYLDDGLYGSYSNILTEDVHPPILAMRELDDTRGTGLDDWEPVTLAGPTCDSIDVVARDYPMPPLKVGDVVVSPLMGAYTTVTSSRFNGIPATPIVVSNQGGTG